MPIPQSPIQDSIPPQELPKPKRYSLKLVMLLIIMLIVLGIPSGVILMNKMSTPKTNQSVTKTQVQKPGTTNEKPLAEMKGQLLMVDVTDPDLYDKYLKSKSYLYDLKDNKISLLREIDDSGDYFFSPTSNYAAVIDGTSLYLVSLDNPAQRTKLYTTENEKEYIEPVIWSWDGSSFIFNTSEEIELFKEYRIKIYKVTLAEKKAILVTSLTDKLGIQLREYDPIKKEIYLNPLLDPRPAADEKTYRVINDTDGTVIRKVNEGDVNLLFGVFNKAYSKSYVTDNKGSLYEYIIDTKRKRLLYTTENLTFDVTGAPNPYIYGSKISPDETKLYVSEWDREARVTSDFILDIATGKIERIPGIAQLESGVSWSPDGKFLCCYFNMQDAGSYFYFDIRNKNLIKIPFDFDSFKNQDKTGEISITWTTRE